MKIEIKESELREKYAEAREGMREPKITVDVNGKDVNIPVSCIAKAGSDAPLVWKDTDENWEKVALVNDLSEAKSFTGKKKLLKDKDVEIEYI